VCVADFLSEVSEKEFALTRFDSIDLAAIHERVKHLGIIGHSRGYIYKVTPHTHAHTVRMSY
jgi:hypothetical protein